GRDGREPPAPRVAQCAPLPSRQRAPSRGRSTNGVEELVCRRHVYQHGGWREPLAMLVPQRLEAREGLFEPEPVEHRERTPEVRRETEPQYSSHVAVARRAQYALL